MTSVLVVAGTTPYNLNQSTATTAAGISTTLYRGWGPHLPDHVDLLLEKDADIIHLQWPEAVCWRGAESADLLADMDQALIRLKKSGRTLVWTMHNMLPHDGDHDGFWTKLYAIFADRVDGTIHHSDCGEQHARSTYRYTSENHVVIGHGYDASIPTCALDSTAARQASHLPETGRIFLSAGAIRPDKNTVELCSWWRDRNQLDEILILAGSIKSFYRSEVEDAIGSASNIRLIDHWTEPEELATLARAADAMLFVHGQKHLTSGSPHLSQACLLPMIAPDTPYNREIIDTAGWLIGPDDTLYDDLSHLLNNWDSQSAIDKTQLLAERRTTWDWNNIGKQHAEFYRHI